MSDKKVIEGIKLIFHNAGGINESDDPSYPILLHMNLRNPEFMAVAAMFLYPGGEEIKIRAKTREALDEFTKANNLMNHPRLRRATITSPEGTEVIDRRLFIGIFPAGISYADRTVEVDGDYKRLGFLSYATLKLDIEEKCPADLKEQIEKHAATIQAKKGQQFEVSTCGQTVLLGERLK